MAQHLLRAAHRVVYNSALVDMMLVVHWVDEPLGCWLAVVLNVEVGAFHGADQVDVVVAPARCLDSQSLLQTQR